MEADNSSHLNLWNQAACTRTPLSLDPDRLTSGYLPSADVGGGTNTPRWIYARRTASRSPGPNELIGRRVSGSRSIAAAGCRAGAGARGGGSCKRCRWGGGGAMRSAGGGRPRRKKSAVAKPYMSRNGIAMEWRAGGGDRRRLSAARGPNQLKGRMPEAALFSENRILLLFPVFFSETKGGS